MPPYPHPTPTPHTAIEGALLSRDVDKETHFSLSTYYGDAYRIQVTSPTPLAPHHSCHCASAAATTLTPSPPYPPPHSPQSSNQSEVSEWIQCCHCASAAAFSRRANRTDSAKLLRAEILKNTTAIEMVRVCGCVGVCG